MYKIIEKSLTNKRSYTLGKIEKELSLDEIFIYVSGKETNKYKVIEIDNIKMVYKVILWELGTFYNADWANNR